MLIRVGTIGTPCSTKRGRCRGSSPVRVLDAVDSGVEHVIEGVLGEAVRGDPGAFVVGGLTASLTLPGRETGGEVAGVAVDPVPHQLDPAVPGAGLLADGLHEVLGLHLDGEAAQVAAGPCDVPAGADDAGQVGAVLDPAGVVDGAGVPDQQGAGVAVGQWPAVRRRPPGRPRRGRGRCGSAHRPGRG